MHAEYAYFRNRDDDLEASAAEAIAALGIDGGIAWNDLARRVATRTGKAIRIHAVGDEQWENTTGALSRLPGVDLILVRHTDTELYQCHSILHEYGHILHGDPGCSGIPAPWVDERRERRAELIAYQLAQALYRPPDYEDQRVLG